MKARTQTKALDRLEADARRAVRTIEDRYTVDLQKLWRAARHDVKTVILSEYSRDFPGDSWHITAVHARGTLHRIEKGVQERLHAFRLQYAAEMGGYLDALYREEAARGLWLLDVTTPGSHRPQPPLRRPREALSPRDYRAGWEDALETWLAAYQDGLRANLRMEALHEGSLADAGAEAEAVTIDGFDPADKFAGLFTNQAILAQQDARDDLADANDDLILEEIWMTMEDGVVCPICEKYDGEVYEEVDDEIPAHYNCRCYTRLVPKAWAEILRSGDAADRDAALLMDDRGEVPDAMAVLGPDGALQAHVTVSFSDWAGSDRGMSIYGRAGAGGIP